MRIPEVQVSQTDLTVHEPITLKSHGGRKLVTAPEGELWTRPKLYVDQTLIKALGRAWRWKGLLERGTSATSQDLASAEKINPSYLARILRLTLLAPDIVEALLGGRQSVDFQLVHLLKRFPVIWEEQRAQFTLIT